MPETIAAALWSGLGVYALIGAGVAAWLFAVGLARVDQAAAAAPLYVKMLWGPGMVALWPLMLARLRSPPPEDRS